MTNNRRTFLRTGSALAGIFLLNKPIKALGASAQKVMTLENLHNSLVIYHTNDLHGTIGDDLLNNEGVRFISKSYKNNDTLGFLLDAGDFLNGLGETAYDKKVIQLMNQTGYHAATLGNKEMANGEDHLAALTQYVNFNLINCNYTFTNPVLQTKVLPYAIFKSGQLRIGITGVGPKVQNITGFKNPYKSATEIANKLKLEKNCDVVICLSHLGTDSKHFNNKDLALESENIDIIIGGHGENKQLNALVLRNKLKQEVIIRQGAENGSMLGKMTFDHNDQKEFRAMEFRKFRPQNHQVSPIEIVT
ncbi:hypothetical protein C3K47_19200 [Solitalea longa]|uniref:Calcineurin-like phosphoesterase domain-containing protein n=1 Tax=Solitalea longa TaxID=2079460 RepID=A0A2S4ZW95_9SPHI|nr:metallophosphoesterase [Solitalea longa]POY34644.1 hypothetical protein C3K47_19200 [Solitalea longa]